MSPVEAVKAALPRLRGAFALAFLFAGEENLCAVISRTSAEIYDAKGAVVHRAVLKSLASVMLIDKGNHRHFMAKEIHEQPEVVGHTLANYLDMVAECVALPMVLPFDFRALKRVSIAACGTAYYAGMIARYWFERFTHLPVEVDIASEFRYRDVPLEAGELAIFISQSGETADTLASLRCAREHKQHDSRARADQVCGWHDR